MIERFDIAPRHMTLFYEEVHRLILKVVWIRCITELMATA